MDKRKTLDDDEELAALEEFYAALPEAATSLTEGASPCQRLDGGCLTAAPRSSPSVRPGEHDFEPSLGSSCAGAALDAPGLDVYALLDCGHGRALLAAQVAINFYFRYVAQRPMVPGFAAVFDRFREPSASVPLSKRELSKMLCRLRTAEGRTIYARRKCTVEPVFGILKHVMGFRQFHGFEKT